MKLIRFYALRTVYLLSAEAERERDRRLRILSVECWHHVMLKVD